LPWLVFSRGWRPRRFASGAARIGPGWRSPGRPPGARAGTSCPCCAGRTHLLYQVAKRKWPVFPGLAAVAGWAWRCVRRDMANFSGAAAGRGGVLCGDDGMTYIMGPSCPGASTECSGAQRAHRSYEGSGAGTYLPHGVAGAAPVCLLRAAPVCGGRAWRRPVWGREQE